MHDKRYRQRGHYGDQGDEKVKLEKFRTAKRKWCVAVGVLLAGGSYRQAATASGYGIDRVERIGRGMTPEILEEAEEYTGLDLGRIMKHSFATTLMATSKIAELGLDSEWLKKHNPEEVASFMDSLSNHQFRLTAILARVMPPANSTAIVQYENSPSP